MTGIKKHWAKVELMRRRIVQADLVRKQMEYLSDEQLKKLVGSKSD